MKVYLVEYYQDEDCGTYVYSVHKTIEGAEAHINQEEDINIRQYLEITVRELLE
jgi:hypothetical protein